MGSNGKNGAKFNEIDRPYNCGICNFLPIDKYGELGKKILEVHHLKPVSDVNEGEETLITDLIQVCPNCHSPIHKGDAINNFEKLK